MKSCANHGWMTWRCCSSLSFSRPLTFPWINASACCAKKIQIRTIESVKESRYFFLCGVKPLLRQLRLSTGSFAVARKNAPFRMSCIHVHPERIWVVAKIFISPRLMLRKHLIWDNLNQGKSLPQTKRKWEAVPPIKADIAHLWFLLKPSDTSSLFYLMTREGLVASVLSQTFREAFSGPI